MILDQFLTDLVARGGSLRVDEDRLIYRGPPGSLAPCDEEFIRDHKPELIERIHTAGPFEPIAAEDLPAWLDDDLLSISMTAVRASIEAYQETQRAEARSPRQPGRDRQAAELARAEANLDAMQSSQRQPDDEPTTQEGGTIDGQ